MTRQVFVIRSLGAAIALFGTTHMLLNIFVIGAPFFIERSEMVSMMRTLANIFGPIAIREDMNTVMLCIKVTVSALFLTSGIGIIKYKEWARKLLFLLLSLRLVAGAVICVFFATFYLHMAYIIIEFLLLVYCFTRPQIRTRFAN